MYTDYVTSNVTNVYPRKPFQWFLIAIWGHVERVFILYMYIHIPHSHKQGDTCPACSLSVDKGGKLVQRKGKFGLFLGCSRYPLCKITCKVQSKKDKKTRHHLIRQNI